ncbi:MAG: gliding motility-associated C-terminal domain-containing protein, partial [Bacteroidetes bacterium]|nr:gliding motility-associated C-terminal domain-containing protein [Bacteroidota bacterium]
GVLVPDFMHNHASYQIDGDSLSYIIVITRQELGGEELNNDFPNDAKFGGTTQDGNIPTTYTLDELNGTITWDAPGTAGEYNIAFVVEEWRKVSGLWFRMGFVTRDMQIIIEDSENDPPELVVPLDTCVVAGTFLQGIVVATDPNNTVSFSNGMPVDTGIPQPITLEAFGGPFEQISNVATFSPDPPVPQSQPAVGIFSWQTDCSHVRERPYQVVFKAIDEPPPGPKLVDFKTWDITVIAPAPILKSVDAKPNRSIELEWEPYTFCQSRAEKIQIWRRVDSFEFDNNVCIPGIPSTAGYILIKEVGIDTTDFVDDNFGEGLDFGANYCYRLVAKFSFPQGGESLASNEICAIVKVDAPVITNVSVLETDVDNGEIFLRWTTPFEIDMDLFPPPYTFDLIRSEGLIQGALKEVLAEGLTDTVFVDSGLNTLDKAYNYQLITYDGNERFLDSSAVASTVKLNPVTFSQGVELFWQANVPWSNNIQNFPNHLIFRDNVLPSDLSRIVLIDSVNVNVSGFNYLDEGQFNSEALSDQLEYCYYVTTKGSYGNDIIFEPLLNNSQIICVQPNDTIPPCGPASFTISNLEDCEVFLANSACNFDDFFNELSWELDEDMECQNDIRSFNVYASDTGEEETFELIASNISGTSYIDEDLPSFARCYKISSVDRSGLESELSETICRDNCPFYGLPNVFTPNGDQINDTFRAFDSDDRCSRFVESVKLIVTNRWGREVFNFDSEEGEEGSNFLIDWDGRGNDGTELASGVYYYEADIIFDVLDPNDADAQLRGWIHLLR